MADLSVLQTYYVLEGRLARRGFVDEAVGILRDAAKEYPAYRISGEIERLLRGKHGERYRYAYERFNELHMEIAGKPLPVRMV